MYWFRLDDECLSALDLGVFVAFAIHVDAWPLSRCCHMLFGKLVFVKDLSLFGSILVNKRNLDSTRLVCLWLFFLLAINDSLFGSEPKFFESKLYFRRWLVQSKIH